MAERVCNCDLVGMDCAIHGTPSERGYSDPEGRLEQRIRALEAALQKCIQALAEAHNCATLQGSHGKWTCAGCWVSDAMTDARAVLDAKGAT